MNGKLKRAVDVLMTTALLILAGYQFWGGKTHEWVGGRDVCSVCCPSHIELGMV